MHACMASGRTDPACCSSLSFQNARIKSIFSSKASAASSASAMATGHKDLHRPTHTNGHVAQYGGNQDAMDERCDDGDNQSRARRRRGRWQRRRESPRWSKSRAALFSLANGQVTATPSAGFLRESLSLRPRAVAVSKQWGRGCRVDASSALRPLPCAVGLTGERQPGAPRIDRARAAVARGVACRVVVDDALTRALTSSTVDRRPPVL